MIRINKITKKFDGKKVLHDITLHVRAGEIFACLGPEGAGKSTLVRILTGQIVPDYGKAFINGFDIQTRASSAARQFGLVSPAFKPDLELSVCENLVLGGLIFEMDRSTINRRARELFRLVRLDDRLETPAMALSGGPRRRLMIARALVHEPRVLIIDEPTIDLEAKIRTGIWELIKQIQAMGITIFFTTPSMEEAEYLADRVVFINEGQIVETGTPSDLAASRHEWTSGRPT